MDAHEKWMDHALALAERGRGWVSPNPVVGAVVVRDDAAVGQGWHREFGGPHAEVLALREAGDRARGATLYCTLEPCNHSGKTPPCTRAVIESGIARVVLGARDPNPAAAGGVEALRAAGIEIIEGVRERECRRINAPFFKFMATGLPLVTLKWAMSLDGRIATRSGDSKWISGDPARAIVHRMRARHDAVLAGVGTVMVDDPSLNARLEDPAAAAAARQPRRVVLDPSARMRLDGMIWTAAPAGPLLVAVVRPEDAETTARIGALRAKGAEIVEATRDEAFNVSAAEVLRELGKRGVLSVLVEGGAHTHGQFIDARLADRVCAFVAPAIVGGKEARSAVNGLGAESMADAWKLIPGSAQMQAVGDDFLIEGALSEWGAL